MLPPPLHSNALFRNGSDGTGAEISRSANRSPPSPHTHEQSSKCQTAGFVPLTASAWDLGPGRGRRLAGAWRMVCGGSQPMGWPPPQLLDKRQDRAAELGCLIQKPTPPCHFIPSGGQQNPGPVRQQRPPPPCSRRSPHGRPPVAIGGQTIPAQFSWCGPRRPPNQPSGPRAPDSDWGWALHFPAFPERPWTI